jgi:hypothetical protein
LQLWCLWCVHVWIEQQGASCGSLKVCIDTRHRISWLAARTPRACFCLSSLHTLYAYSNNTTVLRLLQAGSEMDGNRRIWGTAYTQALLLCAH